MSAVCVPEGATGLLLAVIVGVLLSAMIGACIVWVRLRARHEQASIALRYQDLLMEQAAGLLDCAIFPAIRLCEANELVQALRAARGAGHG